MMSKSVENKTLTVERNRGYYGIGTPKTKNSYRTIKIYDVLINQLKSYKTQCKESMLANGIIFEYQVLKQFRIELEPGTLH